MPFAFKLANRLARLRGAAAVLAAATGFACSNDPTSSLSSQSSIASIEVAPSDLTGTVGASSQFTAIVRDVQGRVLADPVTWSSSDYTVAQIRADGVGTAVGPGTAQIIAAVGAKRGSARTTIRNAPPGTAAPATVTDLAVGAVTDTSVTLSFTEVGNGSGQPATYLLRYAASPMNWASASAALRGTCGAPVAGTGVGNRRNCVVSGLSGGTAYDFQIRGFRAQTGQDTVFGGLSNIGKGVTAGVAAAIASIAVSPGSVSQTIGGTTAFTVTVKDAAGTPLTGRNVAWSSSNSGVASVDASGTATAIAAGSADIVASVDGKSASATMSVSPASVPSFYSNQPAGYTRFVENDFHTQPVYPATSTGLLGQWWSYPTPSPNLSMVDVSGAPQSAPSVIQTKFPAGLVAGSAPAIWGGWDHGEGGTTLSKMYVSMWIRIPGADFENQLVGTKIAYLGFARDASTALNDGYLIIVGDGTQKIDSRFNLEFREQNNVGRNIGQNVDVSKVFTVGPWHHFEMVLELNHLGSADGKLKWWVDNDLIMDYSDITYIVPGASGGFQGFKLDPVWGGLGGVRTRDDYMQVDHLYVSGVQ